MEKTRGLTRDKINIWKTLSLLINMVNLVTLTLLLVIQW
jgi:hypothetical protein